MIMMHLLKCGRNSLVVLLMNDIPFLSIMERVLLPFNQVLPNKELEKGKSQVSRIDLMKQDWLRLEE